VFLDMFGDPVTNPKGWKIGAIRDLAESVNYGTSSKAGATGQYPILRMGNITYEGFWDFSDLKYIDLSEKDQTKYLAYKNDVLFNRTNSKELVGKTAVYRKSEPMAFAGYLVRLITNARANPEYLSAYMNTKYMKQVLEQKCKSIVGMANINAQEFQNFSVLIPPIEIQNDYAEFVDAVLQKKPTFNQNLTKMTKLFNSLQQRAFRGELTSSSLAELDTLASQDM
ncbi:MAG: restriction endonuclease subunit S, partial [Deinococcota bacterium]